MLEADASRFRLQWRGAWQSEAIETQQQRGDGRHQECVAQPAGGNRRLRIPGKHKTDHHAGHDPANGAPHTYARELQCRVAHLAKRDRVHQRQGRHVNHHVRQHERVKRAEVRRAIELIQQHRAHQMQHREDAFGVEETVSDQTNHERGNDRPPGLSRKRHADLPATGAQVAGEERTEGDEPAAPDKELQEHHCA
ncbi:hypothetical protein D3C87_1498190 [compost metagenome]